MCGIAGQARGDGGRVDRTLLETMCSAIEHRGPDSRGLHLEAGVGLGIQRLRVIDLATGDQPLYNEDRSVAVVLNGEIYNYRELRDRLAGRGHVLATQGDTEVIAHLYEEEGPDCVRRLHGMFAVAIWDAKARQLTLARDRVGKKPLFYSLREGCLTFASELGALMADPEIPRELDHRAIDAYLALRYVPAPFSAFAAVRKLPPASTLTYRDGRARIERYWQLDYTPKRAVASEAEVHEEVRDHIRAAVRRRMVADVPLGAFLSGGVDSSAVVAAMAEASPHPVRTFSIGFSSDELNELPQARIVAERFGTEHHEHVVEPSAVEIIPKIVRHYGEPFGDPSAIPSFYLAEMARGHVTVALNGDGGDESFAGYQRYASSLLLARLDRVPAPLRRGLARAGEWISPGGHVESWRERARRMSAQLPLDPLERYTAYVSRLNGLDRDALYTDEYRELVGASAVPGVFAAAWEGSSAVDLLDKMLAVDVEVYLPGQLLTKIDIATMAHSLEGRSPLLDHELMEFAASLPPDLKLRGREKKVALRGALRGWIPDEILDGPKKGFKLPIADWFRGELRGYAREMLLDPVARGRGFFREPYVRGLLDRHAAGQEDNSLGIWNLLNLELWHRELVDRRRPAAASTAAAA